MRGVFRLGEGVVVMPERRRQNGITILIILVLAAVAMPVLGFYLVTRKDGSLFTKTMGYLGIVLGVLLWIYFVTAFLL